MKEKIKNISITLKEYDKLTMKPFDGKVLAGEGTNIKTDRETQCMLR